MKALNEKSSKVLRKLIDCMNDPNFAKTLGSYAKIGKPDSCYMPVSVEKLAHIPTFDEHIVVSHTYEREGDLIRDPEMEFVSKDGMFYPITYRQDDLGIYQQVFTFSDIDGRPIRYKARLMADLAEFANQWMLNINCQQQLGVEV
jgi:hypothetical protein